MFFVRKENINTIIGTQKEFAAAERRGIGFFASESRTPECKVWHYLWPADKVEPSLRENIRPQPRSNEPTVEEAEQEQDGFECYIWSQEVQVGSDVGEPLITGYNSAMGDWQEIAKQRWSAANGGGTAVVNGSRTTQ